MKKYVFYSALFFIVLTGMAFFISNADEEKVSKKLNLFSSVFKILRAEFVDTLDSEILIRRAIDGMVKSVDPHTVFFDSIETIERENVWRGINYSGIGARVFYKDSSVIILSPIEGYGAQLNDLRAGDIYINVDGQSLKWKSLDSTVKLLRGPPETIVNIVVERPYVGIIQKKIVRKQIITKSVPYYAMIDSVTGYIQVQQFLRGASIQFLDAVADLKKNTKLSSIIIDLRDNIGGLVEEAVNCLNVFVPKNTLILNVKGKATDYNNITLNDPLDTLMPLVILTNKNTVSAGEIFTGSMQDLDRAVVIGQKTFGKGLVQGTRFPGYGTSLYLTAARYFTPSGRCIQKRDYSQKYINGKESMFPDSLKKVFYTRNGRKVYDIGGVEPDIKLEPIQESAPILVALKKGSLIFDFATYYRNTKEIIGSADKFIVTDNVFREFLCFVEKRKAAFKFPEELKLIEFEELSKNNNTISLFDKKYKSLYRHILQSKNQMFIQNKDEIKKALKDEILGRYYNNTGQMQYKIQTDLEVIHAQKILSNIKSYFLVLGKK